MTTERNYNGVTIEKTWSFIAFAKQFGKPKLAPCVNHDTGETFKSLVFDNDGELTWCHFGYSTAGMTGKEIAAEVDNLKVGLNSSGKYTLFKQGENAWEDIEW